jgi:hypothetical protein
MYPKGDGPRVGVEKSALMSKLVPGAIAAPFNELLPSVTP